MEVSSGSGYNVSTGIYSSKLPSVVLPEDSCLGLAEHILSKASDSKRRAKIALVDAVTGQSVTYGQLDERVRALAAGLIELGVSKGTVVLLLAPNCVDFPVVVLATMLLGGIVTTANPNYTAAELEKQLHNSNVSLVFSTADIIQKLRPTSRYVSSLRTVLFGEALRTVPFGEAYENVKMESGFFAFSDLLKKNASKTVLSEPVYHTDTALVLYSSGTTGLSKGVVITHYNLISFATIYNANPLSGQMEDDVYLCMVPQFHVYGLAVLTIAQLIRGITTVILPKYTLANLLEAVQKYRITHLPLVPPILLELTKQTPETLGKYDLRSLTQISCGAAPLHRTIMERCSIQFPGVKLQQGYGMTESTAIGATSPIGCNPKYYGSVGLLACNTQAKVVDVDRKVSLPPNVKGELWLRSPGNMKGYLNNEKATAEVLDSEGWLHTGDIVYFNDEGYLFVVDRIKEFIKYKGFQVAPAELEALLLAHPDIKDAAVIPYPDEVAGEIPMAFIVRWPKSKLTQEDVKSITKGKVASFKKVRKVAFVQEIPKLPSGKILRRVLKEYAQNLETLRTQSKL